MTTKQFIQSETGMKKWIDQLRLKPDHYGARYWRYHLSGNVMELLIEKPYGHSKSDFRKAVIYIGRVLQALSELAEQQQQSIMIQSFPSLEDLHIAAAVRIQKAQAKNPSTSQLFHAGKTESLSPAEISAIAERLQLNFQEISEGNVPDKLLENAIPESQWFVLSSSFDNPFTWLRTGQCQEAIHQMFRHHSSEKQPLITSERPFNAGKLKNLQGFEKRYIQSIVGL